MLTFLKWWAGVTGAILGAATVLIGAFAALVWVNDQLPGWAGSLVVGVVLVALLAAGIAWGVTHEDHTTLY